MRREPDLEEHREREQPPTMAAAMMDRTDRAVAHRAGAPFGDLTRGLHRQACVRPALAQEPLGDFDPI